MPSIAIAFEGKTVAVSANCQEPIAWLERRFRRMLAAKAQPDAHVIVRRDGSVYNLEGDAAPFQAPDLTGLARQLEYAMLHALIQSTPDFLWLHAGAAAMGGGAAIFCGPCGSGKSTLTLGLCERGWRFLSDDLIPLRLATHRIHPFLRTPWRRLAAQCEMPPERINELAKRETDLEACAVAEEPAAPALLVFPVYRHGAPQVLAERISESGAVMELVRQSANFGLHGPHALQAVARLARDVPAWRLAYGDGVQARAWIEAQFHVACDH